MWAAAGLRQAFGQDRRLIVAAAPEPPAMERHGDEKFRVIEKRATRALEPTAEGGCVIQPVAMLESEDQRFRRVVISEDCARPIEIAWLRVAGAADRLASGIDFERCPAAGAQRTLDESDVAPAFGTERMGFENSRPARDAKRRKEKIERKT